jgi:hypothetical protein
MQVVVQMSSATYLKQRIGTMPDRDKAKILLE